MNKTATLRAIGRRREEQTEKGAFTRRTYTPSLVPHSCHGSIIIGLDTLESLVALDQGHVIFTTFVGLLWIAFASHVLQCVRSSSLFPFSLFLSSLQRCGCCSFSGVSEGLRQIALWKFLSGGHLTIALRFATFSAVFHRYSF